MWWTGVALVLGAAASASGEVSLAGARAAGNALPPPEPWAAVRFLVGEWAGEGSGQPGTGAGGFSFRFELGEKVLVRRSSAEYPSAQGRPTFRHDDLMIVYAEPGRPGLAAIYFDNEGHVIHYQVTSMGREGGAVFLSEPTPGAPHYRLTYELLGANEVGFKFEIAPPGEPAAFGLYLSARCHRVAPS